MEEGRGEWEKGIKGGVEEGKGEWRKVNPTVLGYLKTRICWGPPPLNPMFDVQI